MDEDVDPVDDAPPAEPLDKADKRAPPPPAAHRPIVPPDVLNAIERIQRVTIPPETFRMAEQMRRQTIAPLVEPAARMSRMYHDTFAKAMAPALLDFNRYVSQTIAPVLEQFQRSLAASVIPSLEKWQLQLPKIQPFIADFARIAQEFRLAWERALPPNWAGLEIDEVMMVIDRVRASGYCLVWVPHAEIIREVLDSDDTARVLMQRSDDVLQDCMVALNAITAPELRAEADAAADAVRSYQDGHTGPAQAMASSVFTSTLHVWFETHELWRVRKAMENEDPEEAGISHLRLCTIYVAGNAALRRFDPAGNGVDAFNRHNTAHRITTGQWTPANGLAAIMLAVALLRELDHWAAAKRELEGSETASVTT